MTDLVPVTRTIVGAESALDNYLRHAHSQGRLVTPVEDIQPYRPSGRPNLWAMRVQVLEPAPKPTLSERLTAFDKRHPLGSPMLKAGAFGIAISLGVLALLLGVFAMVKHVAVALSSGGAGLLVLALLLLFAWARTRSAAGRHSGHTGEGWHYGKCK
jgi:hypothetical protein